MITDHEQTKELERRIAELEAERRALKAGFFAPSRDETVKVPEPMRTIFSQAQAMVREFFQGARSDPSEGTIEIDGDRYILVRASALSTNFIDAIVQVYADRGRDEAEAICRSLLFDLAHTIGLNDARNIHRKMGLVDPIAKLSAGPVHFAYAGWAFVDIRPESNPVPNDDFVIMYDHPYSFEAHTWLSAGRTSEHPVCVMNAGYSSGWCEESFGIPLTAVEVTCRARGDAKCTFLMAPPLRIVERVREYFGIDIKDQVRKGLSIPTYFERKVVEDKLRKSERMFRAVVDQTYQFIGLLKIDGTLIDVNETALAFSGIDKSAVMNKLFWEGPWWTHSPELQEKVRDAVKRTARGEFVRFEATHPAKDGSLHYIDFSMKPVHDDDGKIIMLLPEGRDITERKFMEEELRRERDFRRTVIEASPAYFVAIRGDGTTLSMNQAMLKALGYKADEVVGKDYLATFVPPSERAALAGVFTQLLSSPLPSLNVNRVLTASGKELIVEWHGRSIFQENGEVDYFFGIGTDITEREKAEEALRESEERFTQVVNRAVVGVFRTGLDGMALLANPSVMKMFDFESLEAFNAAGGVTKFYQNLEDRQRLFTEIAKGPVYGMEIPFHRRDRSVMILSLSAKLVKDDKGNPLYIEGTLEDVTRRRQAEEQLQRTMQELQRSNRELEEFASVASHDLQEPVRKILTFSDRIQTRTGAALDPESKDYLERMRSAAGRMQNLINDLLTYSRVTTQAKPFVTVDLAQVAREVLVDLELRIQPGVDRVDVADLPAIEADPGQIRQLLYNLLSNALKFRKPGQPALVQIESGIDQGRCLIRVRDNGIGFDEKYRESIFGIFKRLHSRSEYEGTGVGLAICKKIADRHGGSITAYSAPGQGATFEVTLPVRH